MKLKVYAYENCETCRRALKFLSDSHTTFMAVPIREQPPNKEELKRMLRIYQGNIRKLFNTAGRDYKELQLKDRLAKVTETEAIELLSQNGNLVKRPFVISEAFGVVGFDADEWKKFFKNSQAS